MTSLKVLSLDFGDNYGTLPNEVWCELKNIQELSFQGNIFEGILPSCLGNLTSLRWLDLSGNYFTGNIDSHPFWRRLTSLEYLDISYNHFEVPLSFKQFANNSKLIYLDVGHNSITTDTEFQNWIPNFQLQLFAIAGCINLQKLPSFLHYQYDLRILAINGNQLPGKFPTWLLENNTRLGGLYARDNALIGPLELPSTSLPHLHTIDVSNNTLNGHIPTNFSSVFPNLIILNMSQNLLEGPIHSGFSDFLLEIVETQLQFSTKRNSYTYKGSILKYMSGIDLSSNRLTGEIPIELGNLSKIHALNLSHNHLIGRIPESFSYLYEVESLDLSYNNLNGSRHVWP